MTAIPAAVLLHLDQRKLGAEVFERLAARGEFIDRMREENEEALENFGRDDRDPITAGAALSSLFTGEGWNKQLALGKLYGDWEHIVGPAIARETKIVRVEDGILTVSATNPMWQQTIRLMEANMLHNINEQVPDLGIRRIVVNNALGAHPRRGRIYH